MFVSGVGGCGGGGVLSLSCSNARALKSVPGLGSSLGLSIVHGFLRAAVHLRGTPKQPFETKVVLAVVASASMPVLVDPTHPHPLPQGLEQ